MIYTGTVHVFGHDVDTDAIIPGRFLTESDPARLAAACFIDAKPEFARDVSPGDIILAGRNFGCGSSREHAPVALAASGIKCVVAQSFSRIFFRTAINIGLAVAECPELDPTALDALEGRTISVDLTNGTVELGDRSVKVQPMPAEVLQIINCGGLVSFMRARLTHYRQNG